MDIHLRNLKIIPNITVNEIGLLKEEEIISILSNYDIIVPTLYNNKIRTVYQHYVADHNKRDIDLVQNIINNSYNFFIT